LFQAWDATWPCDIFVTQLLAFEQELIFAERLITGPKRPPGTHGCQLVEILPGIVNAHFNDLDKPDSIATINKSGKVGGCTGCGANQVGRARVFSHVRTVPVVCVPRCGVCAGVSPHHVGGQQVQCSARDR
jgi:hypothetical protein